MRKKRVDQQSVRAQGLFNGLADRIRSIDQQEARSRLATHREPAPLRFLRFRTVRDRTGLSRSTIWRLERTGEFPKHRRISRNAVGWVEQEIDEWMLARVG